MICKDHVVLGFAQRARSVRVTREERNTTQRPEVNRPFAAKNRMVQNHIFLERKLRPS